MFSYTEHVEQLFAEAPDRYEKYRSNPVTGGMFLRGVDPVGPQKRIALKALKARDWFEPQRPLDAPELPLTKEGRERIKVEGIGYIISLLARSLCMCGYETEGHPRLDEYARGVMASTLTPDFIRNDPQLVKQYPPTPLAGLGNGSSGGRPNSRGDKASLRCSSGLSQFLIAAAPIRP